MTFVTAHSLGLQCRESVSVSIFSHLLEQESPTRGLQGCAMRSAATFVEYIYTDIIIYIEVYKLYVCELRYFTKDAR